MYFEDLTAYAYNLPFEIEEVRNVGWLDSDQPYRVGVPNARLIRTLKHIAMTNCVNPTRGVHPCPFCGRSDIGISLRGRRKVLGSAELWIPQIRESVIFAAPDLIIHYMSKHRYAPPDIFCAAVTDLNHGGPDWSGDRERERLVESYFNRINKLTP